MQYVILFSAVRNNKWCVNVNVIIKSISLLVFILLHPVSSDLLCGLFPVNKFQK